MNDKSYQFSTLLVVLITYRLHIDWKMILRYQPKSWVYLADNIQLRVFPWLKAYIVRDPPSFYYLNASLTVLFEVESYIVYNPNKLSDKSSMVEKIQQIPDGDAGNTNMNLESDSKEAIDNRSSITTPEKYRNQYFAAFSG